MIAFSFYLHFAQHLNSFGVGVAHYQYSLSVSYLITDERMMFEPQTLTTQVPQGPIQGSLIFLHYKRHLI